MTTPFALHFTGYSMYPFLKPGDRIIVKRVSANAFQVGDIAVLRNSTDYLVVHRLVKLLPRGMGIFKGDSLLAPDPEPMELSTVSGRVEAIIRGDRFIPLSTGLRSRAKRLYATLSLKGLTPGALRLNAKHILMRLFPLDESNVFKEEKRFIIATLRGHSPGNITDLDWIKVKELACREGVPGILYHQLKDSDMLQSVLSPLKNYYRAIAALNIINLNALEKLEDALIIEKIEVMTLKGASLAENIYPGVGMRPMSDLDLMVRSRDRERFVKLLHRLGYKRNPLLSHIFTKNRVVIDLHIHALNTDRISTRARLFPRGMEPVWTSSVPWGQGYKYLRRPDDMDNILLLSQHLMKHSFSRLIWLVDIFELVKNRDRVFWTRLSKRTDHLSQRRPLSYTLYLINKLFGHEPPLGSGFDDPYGGLSRLERGILDARIKGRSIDRIGPFMALFCITGDKGRMAFGWETLFPKKSVVEQEFCRPAGNKKLLFYPTRILQTLSLALRQLPLILGSLIRGA